MTTATHFDRSAIMKAAWVIVRKADVATYGFKQIMRRALRNAWADAKHNAAMDRLFAKTESPEIEHTKAALLALECKDRWTQQDYARAGVLRAALHAKREAARKEQENGNT